MGWAKGGVVRGWFPAFPAEPGASEPSAYWHLKRLRVSEAQALACGRGVTVVQVDSGVDYDHPDLSGHLLLDLAYDFGDHDRDVRDLLGHGTATAGLILQVAPCARILPLKINPGGEDFFESGPLAEALRYVLQLLPDHPEMRILNLSIVMGETSPEIAELIREIRSRGVVVVGAAGNSGASSPAFPASLPEVLAVSGTDFRDQILSLSNRGEGLFLSAPAQDIYVPSPYAGHLYLTGTSLSAALVSGILALEMELNRGDAPPELFLAEGSRDLGSPGHDPLYGFGEASAFGTLLAFVSRNFPLFPSTLVLSPGQEGEVFFLPRHDLQAWISDPSVVELAEFQPARGRLTLRALKAGKAELYLYALQPPVFSRLPVSVGSEPQNYLESRVYPAFFQRRSYLCLYFSLAREATPHLDLSLGSVEETGFRKRFLLSDSLHLPSGRYLYCFSWDFSALGLPQGLYEILFCANGFYCQRHLFYLR